MKILFIVPYPVNCAPSQRLKFEQHFSYFREAGIKCIIRPFMSKSFYKIVNKEKMYLKKIIYTFQGYMKRVFSIIESIDCDLIYLHLEAAPLGPPIFEYILKFIKKPIIYDIDDNIFLPHYTRANELLKYFNDPHKIFTIFRLSSYIIVVTNYLKECALKHNSNVTYIPPTIDTDRYHVKDNYFKEKKVCIGWSGSYTTSEYLRLISNVLVKISKKYDVQIKVIGNANFNIPDLNNLKTQDWRLDTETQDLEEFDIGLYPLPKSEWVLGKGGLKALQYMGMGIPCVCSRIGACLEFIRDGINGFLVETEEEWIEKLSLLIENPELRKKIGLTGRKTVEEQFSVKLNAAKYLEVIERVYDKK